MSPSAVTGTGGGRVILDVIVLGSARRDGCGGCSVHTHRSHPRDLEIATASARSRGVLTAIGFGAAAGERRR